MAAPPPGKKPKLSDNGKIADATVADQAHKNSAADIDTDGNLKLVVGPDAVQLRVDATALRRASKVFKRMLFGPFMESHQTADWTVELPEDDPEALKVIFHAAHANFGSMPLDLSLDELYQITVMAEKYAMVGSLQPWASDWTSADKHPYLRNSEDKDETSYEDLQRLCIMYYFGTIQQFQEILVSLVLKSKTNEDGKLLFWCTGGMDEESSSPESDEWGRSDVLPQSVLDFVHASRSAWISRLLSRLDNIFTSCTSKDNNSGSEGRCRSMALGLMIQLLTREKLWPLPSTKDVGMSLSELSEIIDTITRKIERQVVKRCRCGSRSNGSCKFVLPRARGHELHKQLVEDTWTKFWDRSRLWGVTAESEE